MIRIKYNRLLAFILPIIISLNINVCALSDTKESPDPESAMFPSISDMFGNKYDSPHLTIYRPNYCFDIEQGGILSGITKVGANIWNDTANILFAFQKNIAFMLVMVVYFSYEIDFIEPSSASNPFGLGFGNLLENLMRQMKINIFDELSTLMILLLGLFYIVKVARDQKTQVWIAIIQTVVIIALALGFMNQPKIMLNAISNFTKDASNQVLISTYEAANPGITSKSATITACNDIWIMFVHKPWQVLEFGSEELAKKYEDTILRMPVDSDERKEFVKNIAKKEKIFGTSWGGKRVGMLLLSLIPCLIKSVIIGAICLLQIVYQFLFVLIAVFGPFVFLMALVPWWGFRALQSWVSKLLGYASMKIIASFVAALVFTFDMWMFSLMKNMKWYLVMLIQLVIVVTLIWKRDKIFDFINIIRSSQYGPSALNKQLKKDANIEGQIAERIRKGKSRKEEGAYENSLISGLGKTRNRTLEVNESDSKALKNENEGNGKSIILDNVLYNLGIGSKSEKKFYSEEKNVDNLVDMMDTAKTVLERRYQSAKKEAEDRARITGSKLKYPDFVKDAMEREKTLGSDMKFRNGQAFNVIGEMKKLSEKGGSLEELYPEERDYIDIVKDNKAILADRKTGRELDNKEIGCRFSREFERSFGSTPGAGKMEQLVEKHGWEAVRKGMDGMSRKEVKDPVDHLVRSLEEKNYNELVSKLAEGDKLKPIMEEDTKKAKESVSSSVPDNDSSNNKGDDICTNNTRSNDPVKYSNPPHTEIRNESTEGIQHGDWEAVQANSGNEISGSFKSLLRLAEEILQKQYEASKTEAESRAEKSGKKPEYSYFVQTAMSRENMSLSKFDERQKIAVANDLRKVFAAGGKVEEIYTVMNGNNGVQPLQRPNSISDIRLKEEIAVQSSGQASGIQTDHEAVREMLYEFNSTYGKKYDAAFMDKLVSKYGKSQVKEVLSRMNELHIKDGRIKNPAGYMTEALKNNLRDKVNE